MMKNILKRLIHKPSQDETTTEVETLSNTDTKSLYLTVPISIHAKFKAYAALRGLDMQELFIDIVEQLKFTDVTRK